MTSMMESCTCMYSLGRAGAAVDDEAAADVAEDDETADDETADDEAAEFVTGPAALDGYKWGPTFCARPSLRDW